MPSLKFCGECNNLLYPKSDNEHKILLYQCRNCNYQENAVAEPGMAPRVYKNDLVTVSREQAGETRDLETDPTLQRSSIQCPKCGNEGAVFFQDQGRRITTNMTLFFSCTAPKCGHVFRDPAAARR